MHGTQLVDVTALHDNFLTGDGARMRAKLIFFDTAMLGMQYVYIYMNYVHTDICLLDICIFVCMYDSK